MLNAADIIARAAEFKAAHDTPRLTQPGRLSLSGPADTPEAVRRKMADDMRDIAALKESVEAEDLIARGWTREALTLYGEDARTLANAAQERRV
ncbi:hypothetical protein [Aureimonas sp. D3]|uniref:hypothetical protein n=1 Tax=Aureimonas sp. D3 TaxID=1638164 RepID=UPI000782F98E|nr:hypothetical protein [Aureimonas sp. D3]